MQRVFRLFSTLVIMVITATLTGCIRQREPVPCEDENKVGLFLVRAVDSLDRDESALHVVSTVHLSFFTPDHRFVRTQWAELLDTLRITDPIHDQLYVVGWGNLTNDNQWQAPLNEGSKLSAGHISLKTLANSTHHTPDDLFFGSQTVSLVRPTLPITHVATKSQPTDELWLRRQVGAVAIRTINLRAWSPVRTSDFHYVVRGASSQLDYNGQPINGDAVHIPAAGWNSNDDFEALPFRTFATSAASQVTVDIYADNTLIYSVSSNSVGEPFATKNDKILYITIDLSGGASATFKLAAWNAAEIQQQF